MLQFRLTNKNLADKNSIELWIINLALVWADGFQIPVLRQALNVSGKCTENMQDKTIVYQVKADRFSKRLLKVFYPHVIIPSIFISIPFFNKHPNNSFTVFVVVIMLWIIIDMLVSSYKWTINQVTCLTVYNNLFEVEIVTKNTTRVYKIDKDNIKTALRWTGEGGRIKILKLTLLDNNNKIADLYSGGKQKMEYALEEIAYKIKKEQNTSR